MTVTGDEIPRRDRRDAIAEPASSLYHRGMRRETTNTTHKCDEFPPPSDLSALRWVYRNLLPHAGKLYDELAKKNIVPSATLRGRPKGRRGLSRLGTETFAVFAAFEKDQRRSTMLEVGAMIETWEKARGFVDDETMGVALERAQTSDPATKNDLKRLAREYVKEGRAILEAEEEEPWPPRLREQRPSPPAVLRRRFQTAVIQAVAGWLAEAKPYCDTQSPAYEALAELLDGTSVLTGLFWDLHDALRRTSTTQRREPI